MHYILYIFLILRQFSRAIISISFAEEIYIEMAGNQTYNSTQTTPSGKEHLQKSGFPMRPNQAKFFTHACVRIETIGKIQRLKPVYYHTRRSNKTADIEDAEHLVMLLHSGANFTPKAQCT